MISAVASGMVGRSSLRIPCPTATARSSSITTTGQFRFISSRTTGNNGSNNNNDDDPRRGKLIAQKHDQHHQQEVTAAHNTHYYYPILKPGFQPTGINKDGVYLGSTFLMLSPHTLPELDVSALLHRNVYIRNEIDDAGRLSKAKQELQEILQHELQQGPSTSGTSSSHYNKNCGKNIGGAKKMYIMRRHGVPNRLLQHLLIAADEWLEKTAAVELWIDSSGSHQRSLSVFSTDGSSCRTLWPANWDHSVALYLATVKRMVTHMASMTPFVCAGDDNRFLPSPEDLEWKISISRHNKLPLTLFPNDPEVFPVIEWVVPPPPSLLLDDDENNSSSSSNTKSNARKIGKILIRLQGAINPVRPLDQDYLRQSHDVSLIFEANFDITNQTTVPPPVREETTN